MSMTYGNLPGGKDEVSMRQMRRQRMRQQIQAKNEDDDQAHYHGSLSRYSRYSYSYWALLLVLCLPAKSSCFGLSAFKFQATAAASTCRRSFLVTRLSAGNLPAPGEAPSISTASASSNSTPSIPTPWRENIASGDLLLSQRPQSNHGDTSIRTPSLSASTTTRSEKHEKYNPDAASALAAQNETIMLVYQPYLEGGKGDPLSRQSFNMDLHNLAAENPQRAQDVLEIMKELYEQHPENPATILPDVSSYRIVVEGWIQVNQLQKAQDVLDAMQDSFFPLIDDNNTRTASSSSTNGSHNTAASSHDDRSSLFPGDMLYLAMIQGWADDVKDDFSGRSAEKAEALLRRMQNRVGLEPNVKLCTMVLEGWCKRAGIVRGAMNRAEALLSEMEANPAIRPNVLSYTSFIGGLGRSKEKDKARRAEAVLERMERHGVQPDMVAYTSVINCWSKAVSRRERELAASRSLGILSDMERNYIFKEMYHVKPSLVTYQTVIAAIGNSLDENAPELAQDVLKRMYALQESGTIANLKPTTSAYNAVIYALSRAPIRGRLRYVRRAEQIVAEMMERANTKGEKDVQPDVRTWATLLRAWAQCGSPDAAENAQRVLDKLEDMYNRGEANVRPNYVCYTTVMGAWGRSRKKGSLDKMELILKRMEDGYEQTLEADIRPNTVSYVTAIDAFVRRNEKDAAQRAQATVNRMMKLYSKGLGHVRPTRIVFNTLIHAWSKAEGRGAAVNAEKILNWMEAQYREGDNLVRPDEVSMCAVLNAWANQAQSGGAERAQQIWEHTMSVSDERGFPPTITMANIVIKAIARSNDPDAVIKAEKILLQLESDYRSGKSLLRPDVTTYSSVINCCAYYSGNARGRSEALDSALRTFHKLRSMKDECPNNITYGTLFKAIANLMPVGADREELVQQLFDECTEEGLVDSFVLSQVRNASPQLYRDLVEEPCGLGGPNGGDSIDSVLRNIPTEWSANVVDY